MLFRLQFESQCTADLLFDWFGFSYFAKFAYVELDLQVWSNPNKSNRSVLCTVYPHVVRFVQCLKAAFKR